MERRAELHFCLLVLLLACEGISKSNRDQGKTWVGFLQTLQASDSLISSTGFYQRFGIGIGQQRDRIQLGAQRGKCIDGATVIRQHELTHTERDSRGTLAGVGWH